MRFQVWPYFRQEDGTWNLPDLFLAAAWSGIYTSGRYQHVFYSGQVKTFGEFVTFLQKKGTYPVFVVLDGAPVFMAWLNGVDAIAGVGFSHFCAIGPYRRGSADAVLDYWFGFRGPDGQPLLKVLCGVTPATCIVALKLLRLLGWVEAGRIPRFCRLAHDGTRADAVISYYAREG